MSLDGETTVGPELVLGAETVGRLQQGHQHESAAVMVPVKGVPVVTLLAGENRGDEFIPAKRETQLRRTLLYQATDAPKGDAGCGRPQLINLWSIPAFLATDSVITCASRQFGKALIFSYPTVRCRISCLS